MQAPPILQSKKFLAAALASGMSFFAVREGFSAEQVALIIGPLLTFVVTQGVADFGKEREKTKVAAEAAAREERAQYRAEYVDNPTVLTPPPPHPPLPVQAPVQVVVNPSEGSKPK